MSAMHDKANKMWRQFDHTMDEANKTFELADGVFREAQNEVKAETVSTKDFHTLRFQADSRAERRRLFRRFFKMAWQVWRTGKTEFQFRAKRDPHHHT